MADDFTVTQGVGTTIRAVEKTLKKHQVVVLDLGGAGAESLATTTIPVSGTLTADLGAVDTAALAQIDANTDSGSVVGNGVAATAQRVTIASDSTGVVNLGAVDNAVLDNIDTNTDSGAVVGNGVAATAQRVTIASDSTGVVTANLGAVDNAVLDNIDTNTDSGAVVGNGAAATAQRVTIANDSTGIVNLGAVDNAVLDNIDSNTDSGAVVGNGAAATSQRVTLANDSTGVIATVGAVTSITNNVTTKGNAFSVAVTLTVTNGAYSVGDVVGGLITLAGMASGNGKRGIINTVKLAGVVAIPYELWFFTANIATPAADNAAFALVAADELLNEGVIPISSNDYFAAQSSHNIASVRGCGLEYQTGAATTTLYAYMKATAVTSPGTTTLYLKVYGEWLD